MDRSPHVYIAVVDDDESFCRSLARLLRAARYEPIVYGSAEDFLADTKHPRFDCLLLDIELGGTSGLELSRRLSRAGSTAPVIYITAHDDPQTHQDAVNTGCFAFVSKVDSRDVLLGAIDRALRSCRPERDNRSA
jgi:FixJ family two-component response regulator